MTIDPETEAEIRRLFFAEHWKRGTIVSQLGIHPDVVNRVTGNVGMKPGTPRAAACVLDPYKPFVIDTLTQYPRLRSTRLFDMIRERGYAGSLRTLRRYVEGVRPKSKTEAFLRVERLPGEQAQIDWAHVGELTVPGGVRKLWVFLMVLMYSRACFAELVFSLDIHSLRRSLVRAARFFGGVTRQWLFDNPKTVVVQRRGDLVRFHPDLLGVAAELHVHPRVCAPRKPHEKGGVERAVRYFKDRFFAARSFHSIEHGNAQLLEFITNIAHQRPHPRLPDRSVADVFDDERSRLLTLPDPLPNTDVVTPVPVDKTAFICLDSNHYSVPATYASTTLTLVASDTELRLLDGDQQVARHARCWGRQQWMESPAHRAELLQQKRAGRDLKSRDRLRAEVPGAEILLNRWFEAGRNVGSLAAQTLQLLDAYGAAILNDAVAEMISRSTHDTGALAILCEQRRHGPAGPPIVINFSDHVRERDVIPHDLGAYDD
jgi:transposase